MATDWTVLFSSGNKDWQTPPGLFRMLDDIFHFDLDVAAEPNNALCKRFFTESSSGLEHSWQADRPATVTCFMNPPYGHYIIEPWVIKAYEEWQAGATVVALLPARTETLWFQDFVMPATAHLFIRGRIAFRLPCAVTSEEYPHGCGQSTNKMFKTAAPVNGRTRLPVCNQHVKELGLTTQMSVAPFPSVLAFYLQPAKRGLTLVSLLQRASVVRLRTLGTFMERILP